MVGTVPMMLSQAAVQQIVNRMKHHSKRVLISSVKVCDTHARGILPVTATHLPDIRGHFPGHPIVPAVVMLEAMFQLAAVLADEHAMELRVECIHEARFRRIVTPKDMELRIKVCDDALGYRGIAESGKVTVAEATFGEWWEY